MKCDQRLEAQQSSGPWRVLASWTWTRENCIVTKDAAGVPCNISPASGEDRHTATDPGSSEATK